MALWKEPMMRLEPQKVTMTASMERKKVRRLENNWGCWDQMLEL